MILQIQPNIKNHTTFEALAESQGLLFEALELSFPPVDSETLNWYRDCGKTNAIHGVFMDVNPASSDPFIRRVSRERYEESCLQALFCGVKNVIFHSTCFPFLRGNYLDLWVERSAEFFSTLSEKYPTLHFFVENSADLDPEPMCALLNRTNSPRIMACLDIGHAHYSRTSPEGWVDALGDKIGYLHLSDNMGQFDDHLPLGDGTVDWASVDALCRFLPADTPATLEVGSPEGIEKSLQYLREKDLFGGVRT